MKLNSRIEVGTLFKAVISLKDPFSTKNVLNPHTFAYCAAVCLMEATHRVGGRVYSVRGLGPNADLTLDMGAYRYEFPDSFISPNPQSNKKN